MSTQPSIPPG